MEKESKKKLIKYIIKVPLALVIGYFAFIIARDEISNIYFKRGLEKSGKESMADFNTAIKVNPHNLAAYIKKAERLGKTLEALTVLDKAIEICPSLNDTSYIKSEFHYDVFDYAANNLYSIRARLRIKLKKYNEAIDDYTKMTNYPFDYGLLGYYSRGYVYYLKNDYGKAESDVKKAIIIFNQEKLKGNTIFKDLNDYAKLFLCILEYKKGNYKNALKSLNQVNLPECITAFYKATIIAKTGDYKNSVSNYEKYFNIERNLPRDLDFPFIYILPTPFILNNECASKACVNLGRFDDAISLDSLNADAYLGKGIQIYNNKDYERAISELTKAIELNPSLSEAYIKRGVSKYNQKDFEGAISDLSNLDLKNDVDAYIARSYSYYKLNYYSQAISDYDKLLELNPKDINKGALYYNRGIAKQASRFEIDGISDLNIARGLGNKDADKLLRKQGH